MEEDGKEPAKIAARITCFVMGLLQHKEGSVFISCSSVFKSSRGRQKLLKTQLPEPNMSIGADGLFAVREGQDFFTQAAVLWKSLFVHFL